MALDPGGPLVYGLPPGALLTLARPPQQVFHQIRKILRR